MSLFLAYHCPCFDGAYSVLTIYMGIKVYLTKHPQSWENIMNMLQRYQNFQIIPNDKQINVTQSHKKMAANSNEEEQKLPIEQVLKEMPKSVINQEKQQILSQTNIDVITDPINEIQFNDQNKSFFYTDQFPNIFFIPSKYQNNNNSLASQIQYFYNNKQLSQSVLIIMDFSCQSLDELIKFTQLFKKVIILDHHDSHAKTLQIFFQQKNPIQIPQNLAITVNLQQSGATIALNFVNEIFQFKKYSPAAFYQRLEQKILYVEDYDIKKGVIEDADNFVEGLFACEFDLDAKKNCLLFFELLAVDCEQAIKHGIIMKQQKQKQINQILQYKKIYYLNGKQDNLATGYGIPLSDHSLINEMGTALANESIQAGLDNIGIVILNQKNDNKTKKISLRANNHYPQRINCDEIAKKFGGGGQSCAASFFISNKIMQKWLSK